MPRTTCEFLVQIPSYNGRPTLSMMMLSAWGVPFHDLCEGVQGYTLADRMVEACEATCEATMRRRRKATGGAFGLDREAESAAQLPQGFFVYEGGC